MLTAARIVLVAGALTLGTSFLAVQVGDPPDSAPPAAAPVSSPAATDQGDEARATYVTGTFSGNRTIHVATYSSMTNPSPPYTSSGGVYERDVVWSDPRLPSLMRISEEWAAYPVDGSDDVGAAISMAQNIRLEGPDGAWTGTAYGLLEETKPVERYPQTVLVTLVGEGAYEGLSAMLRTTYDEPPAGGDTLDWDGYIFEGRLAPMPAAPEAASSGG
jgi:hypothetical protein